MGFKKNTFKQWLFWIYPITQVESLSNIYLFNYIMKVLKKIQNQLYIE